MPVPFILHGPEPTRAAHIYLLIGGAHVTKCRGQMTSTLGASTLSILCEREDVLTIASTCHVAMHIWALITRRRRSHNARL